MTDPEVGLGEVLLARRVARAHESRAGNLWDDDLESAALEGIWVAATAGATTGVLRAVAKADAIDRLRQITGRTGSHVRAVRVAGSIDEERPRPRGKVGVRILDELAATDDPTGRIEAAELLDAIDVRARRDANQERDRAIIVYLASGHLEREAGARWGITETRVCQIRGRYRAAALRYARSVS